MTAKKFSTVANRYSKRTARNDYQRATRELMSARQSGDLDALVTDEYWDHLEPREEMAAQGYLSED